MSRRTCCSMILVLGMVLALFAVAGPSQAAIQWAGSQVISLDAETLPGAVGSVVASWPNTASGGTGNFVTWEGGTFIDKPKLETITAGQSAVAKKVVRFYPSVTVRDGNNSVLKWDQTAPASITGTGSFSAEGWVYQDGIAQLGECWFGWGDRNDVGGAGVGLGISNSWALGTGYPADPLDFSSTAGLFPLWGAGNPTGTGKFYYYAFVYNAATSRMRLYINGLLNRDFDVTLYDRTPDSPVVVGAWSRGASGGYSFEGAVAKVRIHSGALTTGQVVNNYNFEAADYVPVFTPITVEAPVIATDSIPTTLTAVLNRPFAWGPAPLTNSAKLSQDPTWALTTGPAGMTMNTTTGAIAWATPSPVGSYPIAFSVTTPEGSDTYTGVVQVKTASAPSGISVAGDLLINLDGAYLNTYAGSIASWINLGSLGGSFKSYGVTAQGSGTQTGMKACAYFNGPYMELVNDSAALIPTPDTLTGNDDWTFEVWIQVKANFIGDCSWFGWAPTAWGTTGGNVLWPSGGGYDPAWLTAADGFWLTGGWPTPDGIRAQDRKFHHVVYTWNSATTTFNCYIDGVKGGDQVRAAGLNIEAAQKMVLGRAYQLTGPVYNATNGLIHRVRVHSGCLDAVGVAVNYDKEKAEFGTMGTFVPQKPEFFDMLVFWDAVAGEASAPQEVAFRNDGDGPLTITDIQLTGEYELVPGVPLPVTVYGNTNYSLNVAAVPTTTDEAAGSLVLSYTNGVDSGDYALDLLTNPSSAYVSTTGNDTTGNGLLATPYKTIQKAIDVSTRLGASVRVLAGSYASFSVPGSSDALMRIGAPNGGVTVTNGPVDFAAAAGKTAIVQVKGVNFVPTSAGAPTDPIIRTGGAGALVLSIEGATISSANLGTKSPTLVGALDTSTLDLDLNLTDCVLNGADVSNGVWVQYGTRVDINILRSTINHTDNAVIRNVTGALLIQESTIDTTIGKAVYAGGFLPGNTDPGNWWWASNGPVTLDRCYIVNIGGFYNAGVSADITLSAVFLFTDAEGRDTVTNNVFEGCNAGIQGGWTWDTSFMHVFNNTFIAHTGLTSVGTGVFDDADHFGYLAYNNVVLGFATSISAGDPLTLSNNFDETTQAGPPELNPNFRYQAGAAYALPTGVVGVDQLVPVEPSALTAAGVYAAGVPREDYYGGARSTTAPYIGAFEGVWSAPAIEAIPTQIAVLGRPFATLAPTLTAGYPPSTWTLNAAAITAGMTVDPATGVISWANPGPVAQYPVILTATNAVGAGSVSFTVKVLSQPPAAATYWYLFE